MKIHCIAIVTGLVLWLAGAALAQSSTPEVQLWQAAREGDVSRVKALLERGVPVDAATEFDCTALWFAANADQPAVIEVLAAAGANLGARDNSYGYSAMGMAAWLGHAASVEALLDAGVSSNDAIGGFFAAVGNGHLDVVELYMRRELIPQPQLDAALGTARNVGAAEVAAALKRGGAKPADSPSGKPAETPPATAAPRSEQTTTYDPALDRPVRVARAANWPEFRGAGRRGSADGQHPPVAWDLESGRNVAWQAPVAGLGFSSPVIWKGRVFITTATSPATQQTIDDNGLGWIAAVPEDAEHQWELQAYDLDSGALVWARTLRRSVPRSKRHWKGSQANPTVATNGKYVVALFGSEGLYVYDYGGKPVWDKDLGVLNAGWYLDATFEWGYASSPTIHADRVFVQVDVHGRSFVAAYELKTGRELWRTERDEIPAWGTPVVYDGAERDELVLNASKAVVGYDPATGKELWRIRGNSPITVASPIAQDGLIIATGGYRDPKPIYVVRPGARGDVTPGEEGEARQDAAIAWSRQTDGVYIVTPLLYRGVLYLCKNNGVLSAYDPRTGEQLYRERLRGQYTASPVAADGRVYLTGEDGDVTVIAAGREFRAIARSALDASALATPAISNGKIVFRTVKGLVAVGFKR